VCNKTFLFIKKRQKNKYFLYKRMEAEPLELEDGEIIDDEVRYETIFI
jgi:hypothetical protein